MASYGVTNGSYSAYAFSSGHTWCVLTTNTFTRLAFTGGVPPDAPAVFTRIEEIAAQALGLHLLVAPNRSHHWGALQFLAGSSMRECGKRRCQRSLRREVSKPLSASSPV